MPEPAPNLRPYGTPVVGSLDHPTWLPDYTAAAFERARRKLAAPPVDKPTGRDRRLLLRFGVTLLLALLFAFSISAMFRDTLESRSRVTVFYGIAAMFALGPFMRWWESDGRTHEGTVRAWVYAMRTGRWTRLDQTRAAADRDDFPRIIPGESIGNALSMATPSDILRYWTGLLSRNQLSRNQWMVSKAKARVLAPDLALVNFRLSVLHRYARIGQLVVSLGMVLIMSAFFFAAEYDSPQLPISVIAEIVLMVLLVAVAIITTRRRYFDMSKLVVQRNGRWRIFNGEWQGPEERDLSWLRTHA